MITKALAGLAACITGLCAVLAMSERSPQPFEVLSPTDNVSPVADDESRLDSVDGRIPNKVEGEESAMETAPALPEAPEPEAEETSVSHASMWLRMQPQPAYEPFIPSLKQQTEARLRLEYAGLTPDELAAKRRETKRNLSASIKKEMWRLRRDGRYDIVSLEGYTGVLTTHYLPPYYEEALWNYYPLDNGTCEVVRLSPLEYPEFYEKWWAQKLLAKLLQEAL